MKILLASKMDPEAQAELSAEFDVVSEVRPPRSRLLELLPDRQIIMLRSGVEIDEQVLAAAPRLELVIRAGSGLDNIDREALAARGIRLERIPAPGARSVAEMAFGLMLSVLRRIVEADRSMREARWLKSQLFGRTLDGRTLGIVGLGNIGTQVARLGRAWGMEVVGCVEHPSAAVAAAAGEIGVTLTDLHGVLEQADVVSVHVPLKDSTRSLLGPDELARMRRGAVLIHMARGGVVDEGALLDALRSGHLLGAGVDVHVREGEGLRSPFADLPNVVLTPHLGSTTVDAQRQIGQEILRIVRAHARERRASSLYRASA